MNENRKWYAVYTKARWEKKVAEILTRRNIESYCPLNKVTRQWSDRKKIVLEPLFSSYVFVNVFEKDLHLIKNITGVINLVYWLGKPAVIHDFEIDTIKNFLKEHTDIKLQKSNLYVSDKVRIINGSLMAYEGQILSVGNRTLKLLLPSLGYLMCVEIEKTSVELVDRKQGLNKTEIQYPLLKAK